MLTEIAVGLVGALIFAYLWPRLNDHVSVRRVLESTQDDATELLKLYDSLFSDDPHHYTSEEMIEFIDGSETFGVGRISRAENLCLVAKCHGDVVGFLLCHYYRQARKAIISYYGIDRDIPQARKHAALKLLRKMESLLSKPSRPCDFVLFELERAGPSASAVESRHARSRAVLFRQSAKKVEANVYELEIVYTCPKVSVSEESAALPATLFCVPLAGTFARTVPRSVVLEWLRFLHKDCYGDMYKIEDPRFARHHADLDLALRGYETALPEQVPVRP
jgi:hypothetical protein